jgi:hypothetical protein
MPQSTSTTIKKMEKKNRMLSARSNQQKSTGINDYAYFRGYIQMHLFVFFFFISVVLGVHFQKFLPYVIVGFIPSITLLYPPSPPFLEVSADLICPFIYMCT